MNLPIDNLKTLLDATAKPVVSKDFDGRPFAIVPNNTRIEDLEHLMPNPARKKAKITLTDSDSFIAYINKHKRDSDDASTAIYADADYEQQKISLKAILDDHGGADCKASWREHMATFAPVQTVEWKTWNEKDKTAMSQEEFAAFIEENLSDIATIEGMPTGAQMLQMAIAFEANADKRFRSKVNIQGGGVDMVFVDTADNETESKMRVFERFSLGLAVFLNGRAYRIDARLKYRVSNGVVMFWYELIRPDVTFRDAANDDIDKIKAQTEVQILYGMSA
jgi:uncharacterized protein YfdQ (DUF2303 family)